MDINQVTKELDALFDQGKVDEIPQFLESHIAQAIEAGAKDVLLTLYNEIIGFYRETGQYELSIENCHKAIALMDEMGIQDTIPYATTLLNAANAHRAAGLLQESLELYNKVRPIYVAQLDEDDMYFANLYNNLSLLYQEMNDFASAKEQLLNALYIVTHKPDKQFEVAVTQANLANTCIELEQDDEAKARAEEAIHIFEEIGVDDAHYSAALAALGSLYYMDKDYTNALSVMEKSRECVAKYLGIDNIQYQRLGHNIEIIKNKMKEAAEAANANDSEMPPEELQSKADSENETDAEGTAIEESDIKECGIKKTAIEGTAIEETAIEETAIKENEAAVREIMAQEAARERAAVQEMMAEAAAQEELTATASAAEDMYGSKLSETDQEAVSEEVSEGKSDGSDVLEDDFFVEAIFGGPVSEKTEVVSETKESMPGQVIAQPQVGEPIPELLAVSGLISEEPVVQSAICEPRPVQSVTENVQSQIDRPMPEQSTDQSAISKPMSEQPAVQPPVENTVLEKTITQAAIEKNVAQEERTEAPANAAKSIIDRIVPEITGLELCRRYYEAYGRPMIAEKFGAYESVIAVGLVGKGSDCFGFDDFLSHDHDYGPRFVMWVTKKVYEEIGEELQEAYEQLPKSFMGVDRIETFHGKDRCGVMIIEEFYKNILGYNLVGMLAHNQSGSASGKENMETIKSWLAVHDYALAAAVNGEVFRDDEGIFTGYRNMLLQYYPKAVWYRKLAQTCALFSQNGQYNLSRMRMRGQIAAAELAKAECAKQAMKLYYLLNRKYAPHDKWLYKGMPENPQMTIDEEGRGRVTVAELVERICLLSVDQAHETELTTAIESLAVIFANELEKKGMVGKCDLYLDVCTKELTAKSDALLTAIVANTPIITALALSIAKAEFEAFDKVQNEGGRASCQNNWPTFKIMRMSQYMTWTEDMLLQYLYEFKTNYANGRNMIEEKYARMMESTAPLEYAAFADQLPPISGEKRAIMEQVIGLQVKWMEEFAAKYPNLADEARRIHTSEDLPYDTSYETYLRGELGTYSDRMLEMYGRYIVAHAQGGKNVAREIMENTIHFYGYQDLETANAAKAK